MNAKTCKQCGEMKQRAAAVQEMIIYQKLAVSDPAMTELLSEYESLGGSI